MWLLSTSRAELHFFNTPESVPGGYAILSHVWDQHEQTFQDVRALRSRWRRKPRARTSAKIKQSCKIAQRHGYRWVWIDTCCIDKTSSSELSEAINSMFRYYALSRVCYAYLRDVSSDCPVQELFSDFWRSLWHRRGWTLQELLAPRLVIFLSRDWKVLGTKAELADVLCRITFIPRSILRLEEEIGDICIAQRMSWAANRQTTRPEDQAYCLMGIFGINMPTLYGEGENAFQRLQEEIMKQSPDTTLFAWGALWHGQPDSFPTHDGTHRHSDYSYLFARSPSAFSECSESSFSPPRSALSQRVPIGIPTFSVTPHGVLARLPLVEAHGAAIGVLSWSRDGDRLGLLLTPCPISLDPSRPLYDAGIGDGNVRVIDLGSATEDLELFGEAVETVWKEIYIAHRPPLRIQAVSTAPVFLNRSITTAFRLPEANLERLDASGVALLRQSSIPSPWTGSPAAMLFFGRADQSLSAPMDFVVHLGRCTGSTSLGSDTTLADAETRGSLQLGAHWAYAEHYHPGEMEPDPSRLSWHECPADHIREWPRGSMTFDISCECTLQLTASVGRPLQAAHVSLSFVPSMLNPSEALDLDVHVEGQTGLQRTFGGVPLLDSATLLQYSMDES
ncbi:heterokaryon incompatibility protein-domain-containing protein [Daedaleopsis nitida]|nr:heterokaryon incompatibility protein-domain-containing protein [Daedaleopsis nitida]